MIPFTPDQIFDSGGDIGTFSLLARSRYPTVPLVIFEPKPRNVEWIGRQVRLNAINIEVVHAAVSVREGQATFQDRVSFSGHLVDDARPGAPNPSWQPWSPLVEQACGAPGGRYTVRVIDLPAMLLRRRPERLLVKLDAEGEETHVIPALFDVPPRKSPSSLKRIMATTAYKQGHRTSNGRSIFLVD